MSLNQDSLASLRIDRTARSSESSSAKSMLAALGVVALLAATAYWLWPTAPLVVELATAESAQRSSNTASATLDASGYVVARRAATVASKVTGKIADVLIEEGMPVEFGQLVARLDDSSLKPLLALANSQLAATRKELKEITIRQQDAERTVGRIQELVSRKSASQAEYDRARAEADALAARLDALTSQVAVAEATVKVRQQDLDDLQVLAPFAGVIVSKDAQPGEMVSPMSAGGGFTRTGIATLVDMDSREIEVDVNEAYINRVSDGQRTQATLDAYPDWQIPSHVINIVPTADRQKATVKVRIGFDVLDPRILPNMGIKVSFFDAVEPATAESSTNSNAVLLPASAVMSDGDSSVVWRVRNGAVERVAVRTGSNRDSRIEVLAGISVGDQVVLRAVEGLADGAKVATEQD